MKKKKIKEKENVLNTKGKQKKIILALTYWIGFGRIILGRIHIQSKFKKRKLSNFKKIN